MSRCLMRQESVALVRESKLTHQAVLIPFSRTFLVHARGLTARGCRNVRGQGPHDGDRSA